MMKTDPIRRRRPSEEGYMLVVVVFMLAIMMLALTVAAPVIKRDIQRDREVETMHRGKQYARGVRLYYKKFGAYPASVDALVNTNQIRFLRKKYVDPTTGKDEWKIVRVGQQKTQALGFFGQPIGGMSPLATATGGINAPTGSSSTAGGPGQSGSGSSLFDTNSPGTSAAGQSTPTAPGAAGSSTDPTNGTAGSLSGTTSSNSGGSGPGNSTGLNGQTFGGGPIMGFSPNSPKQSILVYRKKNHYNEWEFTYDPLAEQMMQGGNIGTVGQPVSGSTTPVGSSSPGSSFTLGGSSSSGTNSGSTNAGSTGSSGTSAGSPPTPPETPAPTQ
jgi:type II secretory pathway pseudopilin PulG